VVEAELGHGAMGSGYKVRDPLWRGLDLGAQQLKGAEEQQIRIGRIHLTLGVGQAFLPFRELWPAAKGTLARPEISDLRFQISGVNTEPDSNWETKGQRQIMPGRVPFRQGPNLGNEYQKQKND